MNIKKILVTFDTLTTSSEYGENAIKNLDFIKIILNKIGFQVTTDSTNILGYIEKFRYLTLNDLSEFQLKEIEQYYSSYNLLICFELSENTKIIYDYLNIKYIDIWVSPIRFYKDIMFEFYSNVPLIQDKLKEFQLKDKKLFKATKRIKKYTKYFINEPKKNIQENSALIVGQLFYDKAVMHNNQFLNLTNYKNIIYKMSTQYTKLYFLKHPLMNENDFATIYDSFKELQNIEYLNKLNTYALLCDKNIKLVAGVSSSVLYEAKYFKKEVLYFYKPVISDDYIRIYKKIYKSSFWNYIFNNNKKNNFTYINHHNFLRYKFNAIYSYDKFMNDSRETFFYNNLIKLFTRLEQLNKSAKYILYGYGSVGKLIYPHLKDKIVAIIDKTSLLKENTDRIPFISIKDIQNYKDCIILISSFKYEEEIILDIKKYKNQIITIGN